MSDTLIVGIISSLSVLLGVAVSQFFELLKKNLVKEDGILNSS